MDAREYIGKQFARMRWICAMATQDLTDEELNWIPPGTANTISAILLHLYGLEDTLTQRLCQGRQPVWDSESWAARIGVAFPPGHEGGWGEPAERRIALATVRAYGEATRAATEDYLAALTDDELRRAVDLRGQPSQIADVLVLITTHSALHAGEIATLRGVRGGQGFPF